MGKLSKGKTTEYFLEGSPVITKSLIEEKRAETRSNLAYLLFLAMLFLIMLTIMCLNTFVFAIVKVQGQSMEPTLYTSDVLIANRTKEVERGSIVVIKDENPDDWLIKRVIGIPGDTIILENGYVYIRRNGGVKEKLDEPYVKEQGQTFAKLENVGPWELKENEYFYLGDNRANSSDSRTYGKCNAKQIVGVIEPWSVNFAKWLRNR